MAAARETRATNVRVTVGGTGRVQVDTGLAVLDHLIGLLARYARLDLVLEVAPDDGAAEVAAAGRALGEVLREPLGSSAMPYGSAAVPADEALANVAFEAAGSAAVFSNVDLSDQRVGGLGGDLAGTFLDELARAAGLTLHVRLIEGQDTQHVLETIFKTLGAALRQAFEPGERGAS